MLVAISNTVVTAKWLRPGNSNLWSLHNPQPTCGPVSFSSLCMYNKQPEFISIISNSTFSMQWSLVPVYHVHVLRTGRFPRVQWHLSAKLISSFLIVTRVFLCTNQIYICPCSSISSKFACGNSLGVIKVTMQSLPNAVSIQMLLVASN